MTSSTTNRRSVVIIGAGGHARVLQSSLSALGLTVLGAIGQATLAQNPFEVYEDEALLFERFANADIVIGVGAAPERGDTRLGARKHIFETYAAEHRERLVSVVDPDAILRGAVVIGCAAQVLAGAVIQTGARIGENAVANTGCRIDHDCRIGDHAFIGPGAVLCGGVEIGESTFVGANATILPGVTVGAKALIAAGSTVTRDVPPGGFNRR
ncbi:MULTISPECIES: acetyltransferase [unclassified Rhizobium]|uniref:acetyltransferase n=1 Tax=unclassified Rhizobium TaxID=2613769 RepID=UPI001AE36852|nr:MULTISPECIES: acetyltransferase [unclassified Rhizobium]